MAKFNTAPDSHFHGLSARVVGHVLEVCRDGQAEFIVGDRDAPFAIATVTLPEFLGTVPCDLRGPLVGDAPIQEEDVTYAVRPGVSYRTWASRLVALPPTQTRKVTVLASAEGVITVFGGPLSPQETGDPNAMDPNASAKFWADHALSMDSLTREEV